MQKTTTEHCPVCRSAAIDQSVDIRDVPIYCNVLWPSRQQATAARTGDITIGYCRDCGHVFNRSFDPALMDYTEAYENSLHYSSVFNDYAESLASRLCEKYDLHEKNIIEIGCGKGDFLSMLCARGNNRGFGFDKSYDAERFDAEGSGSITFVQDFYGEKYAHYDADLLVCRHVLEHIEQPQAFLLEIRRLLEERPHAAVYFEVPNALYTLKDMGIWDLIYEHCGYFSEHSLRRVFELAGFDVQESGESFGGQFLYVEATPGARQDAMASVNPDADLQRLHQYFSRFEDAYHAKVNEWRRRLQGLRSEQKRTVIWGGGSKGITFLNIMAATGAVDFVVDLNPNKQGLFVPGTGQRVVAPAELQKLRPDHVIVMNSIYADEISDTLRTLGLDTEVSCV